MLRDLPHLAAVVAWNDVEKTWDCPAHGSRFDCKGKVVQGPANTDLAQAAEDQVPTELAVGRQDQSVRA